jgi:hypothetical protein
MTLELPEGMVPGPIKGGRCEIETARNRPASRGNSSHIVNGATTYCGKPGRWWDGSRILCKSHKP